MWVPKTFVDNDENRAILDPVMARRGSLIIDACVMYKTAGEVHRTWARFFLRDMPGEASSWKFNVWETGNGAD
jgi:hypothetical protein